MAEPLYNLADPVSAHLRTGYTCVAIDSTVGDLLRSLRAEGPSDSIVYFYVIDAEGRLAGVLPTRRVLASQESTAVREIMVPGVSSIPDSTSMLEAGKLLQRYRYLAMPVTDAEGRLLGTVDLSQFGQDLVIGAPHDIQRDVFQLIGLHLTAASSNSFWTSFKDRLPWLLANIGGGLLAAFVVGFYQPFLDHRIILALFIPIVLSLSESVSIQSMTITFERLHRAERNLAAFQRDFIREVVTATLLGLVCGVIVGVICMVWKRDLLVALALCGALVLSMITACLVGFILPSVVHRLKGDPHIASGPIVLVTTDILALLFYLNLAGLLLRDV